MAENEDIGNERKEFEYEFEATGDPRKGTPYVAKLKWKDGKLEREFYNMDRIYGRGSVTVKGKYKVKYGDIVEKREGASWKNDYRNWYFINQKGEEILVANIYNSEQKMKVMEYLKGNINEEELLKK